MYSKLKHKNVVMGQTIILHIQCTYYFDAITKTSFMTNSNKIFVESFQSCNKIIFVSVIFMDLRVSKKYSNVLPVKITF